MVDNLRSDTLGESSSLDGDRAWGFAAGITVLGVAVTRFTHTQSFLDGVELRSRGLETWDVAATFVHSLPPDDLIVGVNLRYIRGTAYSDSVPASEVPDSERNADYLIRRAVVGEGRTEADPAPSESGTPEPVIPDAAEPAEAGTNASPPEDASETGEGPAGNGE